MPILLMVFLFVAAIVLGPLLIIFGYLFFRRRAVNKRELQAIRNELARMRIEMEDIKEQIADFIIKSN